MLRIAVMEPFQRTALFYAYARQFHLAPGTFSTLLFNDRVFLNLRWIPQMASQGLEEGWNQFDLHIAIEYTNHFHHTPRIPDS